MADYYFQNICQPESDISAFMVSRPPSVSGSKSTIITGFSLNQIDYRVDDLITGSSQSFSQSAGYQLCEPGMQAMSLTGLSDTDKTDLTIGLALIIIIAAAMRSLHHSV